MGLRAPFDSNADAGLDLPSLERTHLNACILPVRHCCPPTLPATTTPLPPRPSYAACVSYTTYRHDTARAPPFRRGTGQDNMLPFPFAFVATFQHLRTLCTCAGTLPLCHTHAAQPSPFSHTVDHTENTLPGTTRAPPPLLHSQPSPTSCSMATHCPTHSGSTLILHADAFIVPPLLHWDKPFLAFYHHHFTYL